MTPEERFLENKGLVIFTIDRNFHRYICDEDMVQIGFIGLWKACLSFDENVTSVFSSYAVKGIIQEIWHEIERRNRKKFTAMNTVSMESPVKQDTETTIGEMIPSDVDYFETFERRESAKQLLSKIMITLSDREKEVIAAYQRNNFNLRDTGKEIGISFQCVDQYIRQVRKKVQQFKKDW